MDEKTRRFVHIYDYAVSKSLDEIIENDLTMKNVNFIFETLNRIKSVYGEKIHNQYYKVITNFLADYELTGKSTKNPLPFGV
jgi:hypothetical protein